MSMVASAPCSRASSKAALDAAAITRAPRRLPSCTAASPDTAAGPEHQQRLADVREAHREFFDSPPVHAMNLSGRHVLVLITPDLVTGIYGLETMDVLGRPVPQSWHALAMDIRRHLVRTLDDHTIELSAIGPFIHVDFQEALFRNPRDALKEGEVVDVGVFRAKILRAPENEGPQSVLFRFRERLDSDKLVFLEATKQGLQPFSLPPVGQARVIQPPQIPRGPR
ncbi:MAG: hypothetical protein U0168_21255 [Nannocystaceae bacterium]